MEHKPKRYDHCVDDFLPGNPREDRDGCIRLKSGDLPVTLLHNTTTGYSQQCDLISFQETLFYIETRVYDSVLQLYAERSYSISRIEIEILHCIPTSLITPVMFICFFKIKHD